jgi:uroporphyrinogen decarboxylase
MASSLAGNDTTSCHFAGRALRLSFRAVAVLEAPTDLRAERFVRACRKQPVDVTPVWLMRQAGRSLPKYRVLRARHDFLDVIARADLIAEVTLLPFDELDLDAAIMFADIMLPLAALGIDFDIVESVGPVVADPIRSLAQVEHLARAPVAEAASMVFEAIGLVRRSLADRVPTIGFSGAPFTLACYLVDGRASREFVATRALMLREPATWAALMDRLTDLVIDYLRLQVAAGVHAVQLFDSWVGLLGPTTYERSVLPFTARIVDALPAVPVIHFGTGTAGMLELMALPACAVVGVDHRIALDDAWARIGDKAIQGNLDPAILLADPDTVATGARDVLRRAAGKPGHIFNLGHGVLPDTPLDNIKRLVDVVHAWEVR